MLRRDPINTGTGFVGKGEVQTPWGWNNKQLQQNARGVSFTVSTVTDHEWTCEKQVVTGNGTVREITQERSAVTRTQGALREITRDTSQGTNGPVTGFKLLGFDGTVSEQTNGPAVGSCPNDNSQFVEGSMVSTPRAGGGVLAHHAERSSITLKDTNVAG